MAFKIKTPKIIKNIGNTVGGGAVGSILGPVGSVVGGAIGLDGIKNAVFGKSPTAPGYSEDPQIQALRGRLRGEAEAFEKDLPNLQRQAQGQIEKQGNLALEQGTRGTRQAFNRRGLLYSGLRESGEQSMRGNIASQLAQQKTQSNKELMDMARAKQETAANVGLQTYRDALQRESELSQQRMQSQVARAQVMQQLANVGGQFAGSYYGRDRKTPMQERTDYGGMQPARLEPSTMEA